MTEKLITDCVLEVIQMSCHSVKQLADIRRTLRNILKSLIKESDYITIGVVKRYVDQRNRPLVKSILDKAIGIGLVVSTEINDVVIYKINKSHANAIFDYVEKN